MNTIIKHWRWTINIAILLLLFTCFAVIYSLTVKAPEFMLSCSSELFDHEKTNQNKQDKEHYLHVDLLSKEGQAQINYRYFNLDGTLVGKISMQGSINYVDGDHSFYDISVTTKQETPLLEKNNIPEHYQYLSYVSSLNLNKLGMHNLNIQILEHDTMAGYAVVLIQPSNTVCGCRLVQQN